MSRMKLGALGAALSAGGLFVVSESAIGYSTLLAAICAVVGALMLKRTLIVARPVEPAPQGPARSRLKRAVLMGGFALFLYSACLKPMMEGARLSRCLSDGAPADELLAQLHLVNGATAVWDTADIDPAAPPVVYRVGNGSLALKRPVTRSGRPAGIKSLSLNRYGPSCSFVVHSYDVSFDAEGRVAAVKRTTLQ